MRPAVDGRARRRCSEPGRWRGVKVTAPPRVSYLDESAALWREKAICRGLAEALHVLGHVRFDQRDYADARELFEEALQAFREADDLLGGLPILGDLGLVAYHEGDYDSAERILQESLVLYREHGLKDRVAGALNTLGDLARLAGDSKRAVILLRGEPGPVARTSRRAGHRLRVAQARPGQPVRGGQRARPERASSKA